MLKVKSLRFTEILKSMISYKINSLLQTPTISPVLALSGLLHALPGLVRRSVYFKLASKLAKVKGYMSMS